MTDALASEVLEKLHGAPCLEVLDLSDNLSPFSGLAVPGARAVAGAVETLTGLRELDIGYCLHAGTLAPILQAVLETGAVKVFKSGCTCLRNCTHVDVVADMLARHGTGALEHVEGLPMLGLAANGDKLLHLTLNDQASEAHISTLLELVLCSPAPRAQEIGPHQLELAAALNGNTTLRRLDVCEIATTNEILRELTKAVASCKLTEFRMLDIYMHDVFVELDVLGNLFASTTLRCIELGDAAGCLGFDPEDPPEIDDVAEALATNTVLRILTLDLFSFFDSGMGALARALRTNAALRSLTVKAVFSDDRGAQLADALCDNRSLRFLDLRNRGVAAGQKTKRRMIEALRVNRTLQRVNINGCLNDPLSQPTGT
ncbi:unnamed protein product [Pedinophyceae sp. YPF-701]|nr:unnamed protein product [Pedinophyceae sp. YPF-701]